MMFRQLKVGERLQPFTGTTGQGQAAMLVIAVVDVLGFLLYEIANAGFSCHQLPVAPLPVDVPPPNDEELSKDGDGPV